MANDLVPGRRRSGERPGRLPSRRTVASLLGIGLVLVLVGLVAATRLGAEEDRLLRTGVPTLAVVVDGAGIDSPGLWHSDVVFRYEFQGRTYKASLGRNDDSPLVRIGDQYLLQVDREHPQQAASTSFDAVPAWQGMLWVGALGAGVGLLVAGLISAGYRAVVSRRSKPAAAGA